MRFIKTDSGQSRNYQKIKLFMQRIEKKAAEKIKQKTKDYEMQHSQQITEKENNSKSIINRRIRMKKTLIVTMLIMLIIMMCGGVAFAADAVLMEETYLNASSNKYLLGASRYTGNFALRSVKREKIQTITILDTSKDTIPSTYVASWDVSKANDGSVTAWLVQDPTATTMYHLYLGGNGGVKVTSGEYLFAYYDKCTNINGIHKLDTSAVKVMEDMFYYCKSLTSLDLSSFNTSAVNSMDSMFYYCSGLTSLVLTGFNTSAVTDMSHMFYYCSSLTSLNLSSFNTSAVTDMDNMFYYCDSLISLDLSSFNTSSVYSMSSMFYMCSGLTSLDLSSFNTSSVISMYSMFYNCNSLTSLDLSSFNTSSVTTMYSMFDFCSSLTSLDLSNFDTSSVTYMIYMFRACSSLRSIDLGNFDTSSVTTMWDMFNLCSSLTSLDLSSFDTSHGPSMYRMFYHCSSLTSLDLSSFDTRMVDNMDYMFEGCRGLRKLYLGENFDRINGYLMFDNTINLTKIISTSPTPMIILGRENTGATAFSARNSTGVLIDNGLAFSNIDAIIYVPNATIESAYEADNDYATLLSFTVNNDSPRIEPVLGLYGGDTIVVSVGGTYEEAATVAGFKSTTDTDITPTGVKDYGYVLTQTANNVNLSTPGVYSVTYNLKQNGTNVDTVTRTVIVGETVEPEDQTVREGTTVEFNADITAPGLNNKTYEWHQIKDRVDVNLTEEKGIIYKSSIEGQSNITATETIVINATQTGTLSFDYMVSSEAKDKFTITIQDANGTRNIVDGISGRIDWQNYNTIVTPTSAGKVTLTLTYAKDAKDDEGLDCGAIKNLEYTIRDGILAISTYENDSYFTIEYKDPTDPYVTHPWVAEDGIYRSDSKEQQDTAAISRIEILAPEEGKVSFDYMVSSEEGYDYLYIIIEDAYGMTDVPSSDGLTGVTDWTHYSGTFTPNEDGKIILTLAYIKDEIISENDDIGAIKNLKFDASTLIAQYTCNYTSDSNYQMSGSNWNVVSQYTGVNTSKLTINGEVLSFEEYDDTKYYCIINSYKTREATLNVRKNAPAILMAETQSNASRYPLGYDRYTGSKSIPRQYIETITILDTRVDEVPSTYVASWDVSKNNDGSVTAWVVENTEPMKYTLYIGGYGGVKASSGIYLFSTYRGCTSINGLDKLDTSAVTTMKQMFADNMGFKELDLSNFDTSAVTDMSSMFKDCKYLTSVDVSKFDTSAVTDMSSMFQGCPNLTSIDVGNIDTSSVTNMSCMFYDCNKLTSVDVSKFDTSAVTDMSSMFRNCYNLASVDVRTFDTSSVANMDYMFCGCYLIPKLYLGNNFDKINGEYMFMDTPNLNTIISIRTTPMTITNSSSTLVDNGLKTFNTKAVIYVPNTTVEAAYEADSNYASLLNFTVGNDSARIEPILGLYGEKDISLTPGSTYDESATVAGFKSTKNTDITPTEVKDYGYVLTQTSNNVNLLTPGNYAVTYRLDLNGTQVETITRNVTVQDVAPAITTQPSNVVVKAGAAATFMVTGTGTNLTYKWQQSTNDGSTWTDITGAISSSYTIAETISSMDGQQYRCVISNSAGSATSNIATLTVYYAPTINTQPSNVTVTYPATATFTTAANAGNPSTITYQWQLSINNGSSWNNIDGATSASYTTSATTVSMSGYQYRCIISNAQYPNAVTSNAATLTVNAKTVSGSEISITLNPTFYTYDGTAKTPAVTVKDTTRDVILTNNTDYTVGYSDNTNAGTGKVTITGKGNYTGTKEATFTINKAIPTITASNSTARVGETVDVTFAYTGDSTSFTATSSSEDLFIVESIDQTNKIVIIKGIAVGTATLTVSAAEGESYLATETTVQITIKESAKAPSAPIITVKEGEELKVSSSWIKDDVTIEIGGSTLEGEGTVAYKYSYDGLTWNDYTGVIDYAIETQETTIYAKAYNNSDETKEAISTFILKIDKVGPTINETTITGEGSSRILTIKAIDTISGINGYTLTTSEEEPTTWTNIVTTTSEITPSIEIAENGEYYFWLKDQAGNITKSQIIRFTDIIRGDEFVTTWEIPAANTEIKLPIPSSSVNNYIVQWGDGSSNSYTVEAFPAHTYAEAGEYTIIIEGTVDSFGYYRVNVPMPTGVYGDYYTFTQYVKGIVNWGETNTRRFGFASCTNLQGTIPEAKGFKNLTSTENMFYGCTGLATMIHEDFLKEASNVKSAKGMFMNCTNISGTIPANLFANNSYITNFENVFANCSSLNGEIPATLFASTSAVTSFAGAFNGCRNLEGVIPEALFANATQVISFKETFANCSKLQSPALVPGEAMNQALPKGLFANNRSVMNYYRTFYNCTGLTGSVSEELFINNLAITEFSTDLTACNGYRATFEGCTGIQEVKAATMVIGHEMFKGCTALTKAVLENTIDIGNEAFYACNSLNEIEVTGDYLNTIGTDAFEYTGTNPAKLFTTINKDNEKLVGYEWDSDNRIIDVDAPKGTIRVVVNSYPFTNKREVSLKITITDSSSDPANCKMAIINEDTYSNGFTDDTLPWQDYAENVNWTLTEGDGPKTVYVFFKDEFGNVETWQGNVR